MIFRGGRKTIIAYCESVAKAWHFQEMRGTNRKLSAIAILNIEIYLAGYNFGDEDLAVKGFKCGIYCYYEPNAWARVNSPPHI